MNADLFGQTTSARQVSAPGTAGDGFDQTRDQYFTPAWAAQWLIEEFFPDLGPADYVADAGCGHGAFLGALPPEVRAIGVEVDTKVAAEARRRTGRQVLVADFLTADLPDEPTAIIGNPPWNESTLDGMLARANRVIRPNGRVGWILPCYVFQTPSRVLRMASQWSIAHRAAIPRTLFRGLQEPLAFVVFTKDGRSLLQGFALYREIEEVNRLGAAYRAILARAPGSVWLRCVLDAMQALGGRATLQALYAEIAGGRPTATDWWREKIRQVATRHLLRVDGATYALGDGS